MDREVSLAGAAFELGVPYQRAWNLLLSRVLSGRQDEAGRWLVDRDSLERVKRARSQSAAPAA